MKKFYILFVFIVLGLSSVSSAVYQNFTITNASLNAYWIQNPYWLELDGSTPMTGDIDLGTHNLISAGSIEAENITTPLLMISSGGTIKPATNNSAIVFGEFDNTPMLTLQTVVHRIAWGSFNPSTGSPYSYSDSSTGKFIIGSSVSTGNILDVQNSVGTSQFSIAADGSGITAGAGFVNIVTSNITATNISISKSDLAEIRLQNTDNTLTTDQTTGIISMYVNDSSVNGAGNKGAIRFYSPEVTGNQMAIGFGTSNHQSSTWTEYMTLASDGRLGINKKTTGSDAKLTVYNDVDAVTNINTQGLVIETNVSSANTGGSLVFTRTGQTEMWRLKGELSGGTHYFKISNYDGATMNDFMTISQYGATLLKNSDATVVPLTVQGAASQSANLQVWQTSTGSNRGYINTKTTGYSSAFTDGYGNIRMAVYGDGSGVYLDTPIISGNVDLGTGSGKTRFGGGFSGTEPPAMPGGVTNTRVTGTVNNNLYIDAGDTLFLNRVTATNVFIGGTTYINKSLNVSGSVIVSDLAGTGNRFVCVYPNGTLYASTIVCA